ncbi:hypothetical protein Syn7502_01912 [Synechococcus sp. PCC 7502]|uniref:2OG-Fe(II) oxygenase n=1 Tax=Synechococcus sp. PCC 7502 TaxID=1173263 RepID=UPI00029FCF21|nr:2OG-Fe(II) oxygenase [Synechococcus sp. PCC 7502]AFY73944.1 hypothetical protein Syn7502_01912 [Synechococcus sp. PCC 7502]
MQKHHLDKTNFSKIDALIKHLNLVKQIAESGYWITTDELCNLLSFDSAELEILNGQEPNYSFAWRNFTISQVTRQGSTKLWRIFDRQISEPTPEIVSMPKQQQLQASPSVSVLEEGKIISSEYAWVENFLTAAQHEKLLAFVRSQEQYFVPSANSANDPDYRRSQVLHNFPEFAEIIKNRINAISPYIQTYLRIDSFTPSRIEIQLTMHNHGNYYKIHNDNGSPDCANRVLTFVYYFYREPKAFTGGELVLYDSQIANNSYVAASTYKTVQPQNNSIVFFPSYYMHEVLPVTCPSQAFLDSRFTINGWIRN